MKLGFIKEEEALSAREVEYWSKVFFRNLMVGTEVETEFKGRDHYDELQRSLRPNGSLSYFGNGIQEIKSDGSLNNGYEILTPGRRFYGLLEQYSVYNHIYDKTYEFEPYIHQRAGWHNHIVLQYIDGVRGNEMPVPDIIFKNIMLIVKYFYPSLAYITSSCSELGADTRYSYYSQDKTLRDESLANKTAVQIYELFRNQRYNCINLKHLEFQNSKISKLHFEFRFADGTLVPAQMTTINALYLSILLKAVEVSEFGVLSCEDFESIRPLYMFKNRVQYYDGSYHYNHNFERDNKHILEDNKIDYNDKRLSHPIKQEYKDKIVELGHIMIDFLSNELDKLDKNAVNMCNFLLENPVSKVAKGVGNNIGQINDFYNQFFDSLYTKSSPQTNEVMKLITLRTITNVESTEDWFNKASELIACKEDMTVLINKIGAIRPLGFTKEKGFFVK